MEIIYIYELIDPITDETRYIGRTKNVKSRLKSHLGDKAHTYKVSWIRSLLKQGVVPILNIIDEVPFDEWEFWEKHYINLYRSWNCKLTNLDEGGNGPGKHSLESRLKMSNSQKGKKSTEETKRKISEATRGEKNGNYGNHLSNEAKERISKANKGNQNRKGKHHTEETKRKIGLKNKGKTSFLGKHHSKESKEKIGLKNKGKTRSEECKNKIGEACVETWNKEGYRERMCVQRKGEGNANYRGIILQLNKEGELIKEWQSLKEINENLGFNMGNISSVMTGKLKTAYGFKWKRKN